MRVSVVTSGDNWPDSLAVPAMASRLREEGHDVHGPFLTFQGRLMFSIPAIEAADPELIVVVGGTAAVPQSVEDQLAVIAPVDRIAGADREETAVLCDAYVPTIPEPEPEPGPATLDGWVGNSGLPGKTVPHMVHGGTVDGPRLGLIGRWVESGYEACVIDNGIIAAQFPEMLGWGRRSGQAMAVSGDHAWCAFNQSPSGEGASQAPWGSGFGAMRYSVSSGGAVSPFAAVKQSNGPFGNALWLGVEALTMVAAGGLVYAWLADGRVVQWNSSAPAAPVAAVNPPARPPQVPPAVTFQVAQTPAFQSGGKTLRADCFTDGLLLDPADDTAAYTAKNRYQLDHTTGQWTWKEHLVVDPGDTRVQTLQEQAHDCTAPLRKVGGLLFVAGQMGGLAVVDLATKRVAGTVSVPWGFDVTPDGAVWSVTNGGQVQRRPAWNQAPVNVRQLAGLQNYERIRITDSGRWLVAGWPGPRFSPPNDPWGMVGTQAKLYDQSNGTVLWTRDLPWKSTVSPWDGPKAIATGGDLWATTDLGRDKQPTTRVYRLSDGGPVADWRPSVAYKHGWVDAAYGLWMTRLRDGRYFLAVEDNGNAMVTTYWRTF